MLTTAAVGVTCLHQATPHSWCPVLCVLLNSIVSACGSMEQHGLSFAGGVACSILAVTYSRGKVGHIQVQQHHPWQISRGALYDDARIIKPCTLLNPEPSSLFLTAVLL